MPGARALTAGMAGSAGARRPALVPKPQAHGGSVDHAAMRVLSFSALIVGVILIPTALGLAKIERDRDVSQTERMLVGETEEHGGALDNYFLRARSVVLLTANSPAFANVLAEPGTRAGKVRRQGRNIAEVTHHLHYLEQLYPSSIGEACFIDARGEEFARVVRGKVAAPADLSTAEEQTPFFRPTFALRFGQVHQAEPYVSPDTKEWVVANATLIPQADGRKRAFVHFEVTIESFRRAMGATGSAELRVVDAKTGRVVIDAQHRQAVGARLGVPSDRRFLGLARGARESGVSEVAGRLTAYRRIRSTTGNANRWLVVATARLLDGAHDRLAERGKWGQGAEVHAPEHPPVRVSCQYSTGGRRSHRRSCRRASRPRRGSPPGRPGRPGVRTARPGRAARTVHRRRGS